MTDRGMDRCSACPGDDSCTGHIIGVGIKRLVALAMDEKEASRLAGYYPTTEELIQNAIMHLSSSSHGKQTLLRIERAAQQGSTACWARAYQQLLSVFVPKIFSDIAILELGETDLARHLAEFLDESGVFFRGLSGQKALPFSRLQKQAFEMAFADCFRKVLLNELETAQEDGRKVDVYKTAIQVFSRLSGAFARKLWVSRLTLDSVALKAGAYNVLSELGRRDSLPDITRAMAAIQQADLERVA